MRVNPQFVGISQRYLELKHRRESIEEQKTGRLKHVSHLEKVSQKLQSDLHRKSLELHYLEEVKDRHARDTQQRIEAEQKKEGKVEELKGFCEQSRMQSWERKEAAVRRLQRRKMAASAQVKEGLQQLRQEYTMKKTQQEDYQQSRISQIKRSKLKGVNRANSFFKKKNSLLLKDYQERMTLEEQQIQLHQQHLEEIARREVLAKLKIQRKINKLAQIQKTLQTLHP